MRRPPVEIISPAGLKVYRAKGTAKVGEKRLDSGVYIVRIDGKPQGNRPLNTTLRACLIINVTVRAVSHRADFCLRRGSYGVP